MARVVLSRSSTAGQVELILIGEQNKYFEKFLLRSMKSLYRKSPGRSAGARLGCLYLRLRGA